MRRIVAALLTVNLIGFLWLFVTAKMEPPDWKEPMELAGDAIDKLSTGSIQNEILASVAKSHFHTADLYAEMVIGDFRRESSALWLLYLLNNTVLLVLFLLMRRKSPENEETEKA